nr:peptidase C48, SUMO/sentrin/Ubl1 [Tanacetum cinerariifolium]
MRTRSSSNLPVVSSNPSTSNPKRRNRRRSKQPCILKESPIDTMAGQHTMAKLLRAPTKRYAEAIVVPPILAEQFELKHSLINMMTTDQFFGLEKDNPHDHIRWASFCNFAQGLKKFHKFKDGPHNDTRTVHIRFIIVTHTIPLLQHTILGVTMYLVYSRFGGDGVLKKGNRRRNNDKPDLASGTKTAVDMIHVRVSLWSLHRLIPNLSGKQQEDGIDMGFGAVLGFKIKDVPTRLSY